MKYLFKDPRSLEVNIEKRLILAHRIFLTNEQRKNLQMTGVAVETIGISCPVWVEHGETTEPAQEIFCRYRVMAGAPTGYKIIPDAKGYTIYLVDPSQRLSLLDLKEGGSGWLSFVLPETIKVDDFTYPVIHQVVISGMEWLDRSMLAVHFPHTSSN